LSKEALEDLQYWNLHLTTWNGRILIPQTPSVVIKSDASLSGWGALCNGTVRTRGPWSPQEQKLHINCLELLAATLAVKTFAKDKANMLILLKMDNTSAISYINRKGGSVPRISTADKRVMAVVHGEEYPLASSALTRPTEHSSRCGIQVLDRPIEWKLNPELFRKIDSLLGPLSIDLFASRLLSQLPTFFSWKPNPQAVAMDAFSLD